MDEAVKIEEFEYSDVMQSAKGLDMKTGVNTSASHREQGINNDIDTGGQLVRIKREEAIIEKQEYNDLLIIPKDFVKIEKDEPEFYVVETDYKDTAQLNEKLNIKNETCPDPASSYPDFHRIKTEHKTEKWNESVLPMANIVVKADPDASALHTEFDIKIESSPSTSAVPTTSYINNLPDREAGGDSLFLCYNCEYAASTKSHLIEHMETHEKRKIFLTNHMKEHESSQINTTDFTCIHCKTTFKQKRNLQDHIVRKHPEFMASLTIKIHECNLCNFKTAIRNKLQEHLLKHSLTAADDHLRTCLDSDAILACTKCTFKTTITRNFRRHLLKHPGTAVDCLKTCIHCDAVFRTEDRLNDHILKKHPQFTASITAKIHACTKCAFKTTISGRFETHLSKHAKTAARYTFATCLHCDTVFKNRYLMREHVIKMHPTVSPTWKVHSCSECAYKTTVSTKFQRHLLKHPETAVDYKFASCAHCGESFRSKQGLDCHIIKKHPSFLSAVTRKVHKCAKCDYKSIHLHNYKRHLLRHPETAPDYDHSRCPHCHREFVRKISLDDHIVKNHPGFISSLARPIHECAHCAYKTVIRHRLKEHMEQHPEIAGDCIFNRCIYCDRTVGQKASLDGRVSKTLPVGGATHECVFKAEVIPAGNKLNACELCDATFKKKMRLDDHIVKKHPDSIAAVSSKVHECTKCDFKTTSLRDFQRHLLKHTDTALSSKRARNVTPRSKGKRAK